ncbi:uncharacterized protein N7496_012164 [Penicillium cataractarum]|uniref:Uncharacterized protein n=1 Tax=Penicillium cataractarum TaxID=2100454 RepID=A0A9W9RGK1_9EURO|nr:uncharacterized protein N7496_012164 [Penicillium cataractarum]KAJ5359751.1 hypothetical protein N7496_012164 [Penicillium cataractarum]
MIGPIRKSEWSRDLCRIDMTSMANPSVRENSGEATSGLSRPSITACLRCREQKVIAYLSNAVANVPRALDAPDSPQHVSTLALQIDGACELDEKAGGHRIG